MSVASTPGVMLAGGAGGNPAGLSNPGGLELTYMNLLSGAADILTGTGTKTLIMGSAAIGSASSVQIGITETATEVANNFRALCQIATFCRTNNINVEVDANLTWYPTWSNGHNALVDQWAPVAAAAGLPIAAIQDVQEVGISYLPSTFANYASIEANAVATLIKDYSSSSYTMTPGNLAVGDMEGGGNNSVISEWWNAYAAAAHTVGLPAFSYTTADTGWFAPWIGPLSVPTWQGYLEALSNLALAHNMALNVVVQSSETAASASQAILESEQHAADLAMLQNTGSITVANILVQSWGALPIGVGMISSPTSSSNEAAEIKAVYPLYTAGSITAAGSMSFSSPAQILLNTGIAAAINPLSIQWDASDVSAGNRLTVVVIDQTGLLQATQHGSGTVANQAGNILVLNGNSVDIMAELGSIRLTEPNAGPDTIDVETYAAAGRISDNQISVLAAATGQSVGAIASSSPTQGWITSSAALNNGMVLANGSIMTSETLVWNTMGSVAAGPAFINTVAIHQPLAEYGVEIAPGALLGTSTSKIADVYDPSVDNGSFPANGYANNPGVNNVTFSLTGWLPTSFNPATQMTPLIVQTTTNTFNGFSGKLETSMNMLAPDPLTVVDATGTHADTFATAFDNGGTQVTEFNTGNNPAWQPGWGNQFSFATLTYDDTAQLTEVFLQGGPSNPLFTIDYVFNPNTGELWEKFQSTTTPPEDKNSSNYSATNNPYRAAFATGPMYVTEFNTGNNPNWNYVDWGTALQSDTEVWTDYMIMENFAGFAVNFTNPYAGVLNEYAYEFVNGTALDLMYLPGTITVDLNHLSTVTIASQTTPSGLSGLTEIDAAGATGTVTVTGLIAGGSTLIGGDFISTINGYGHDVIVAGAGKTTINACAGYSQILLSNTAGAVTVSGNNNVITSTSSGTLILNGIGDTVNGSGATVSMATSNARLILAGNNDTVSVTAGSTVDQTGTVDVLNYLSGGVLGQGNANSSVTANGDGVVAWMNASGGSVTAKGNNDRITGGGGAIISLTGSNGIVGTWSGASIEISGQNDMVCASNSAVSAKTSSTTLSVVGNGNMVTGVAGSTLTLSGSNDTVNLIGSGSALIINGAGDTVNGSGATVSMTTSNASLILVGNNDTALVTAGSIVNQTGTADVLNYLDRGVLAQGNADSSVTVTGNGVVVWMSPNGGRVTAAGNNDTITGGPGAIIRLTGSNGVVGTQSGSNVSVAGQNDMVCGSSIVISATASSTSLLVVGNNNTITGIAGSTFILKGSNNALSGIDLNVSTATNSSITVTVETGAGGNPGLLVTGENAVAAFVGKRNNATLEITTGGTVLLNPLDSNLTVKLDMATNLVLGKLSFITAVGASLGRDTITAGGSSQTLVSIGGNDTLIGSASFGDIFKGTASGLAGGTIKNFGGNDTIDITDISFGTLKPLTFNTNSGSLQVADANHSVTLNIGRGYAFVNLATTNDNHGGTVVYYAGH